MNCDFRNKIFWLPFKRRRALQLFPGNVQPKERGKAATITTGSRRNGKIRLAGHRVPFPPSPISEIRPLFAGTGGFGQKFATF
jgi:hypothetical protein